MQFPHSIRAPLALLITYVAVISAAAPINAPPEGLFSIAKLPGSRPTSNGGSVIYGSTHTANLDDPGAFAVRASGEFIGVTHDPNLPTSYSFTRFGPGDDSIEQPNLFTHIDADDTPKDPHATVEGISNVKLSHGRVVPRHIPFSSRGPNFQRCWPTDKEEINNALRYARGLVNRAIAEVGRGEQPNFVTWFGEYSGYMANKVLVNLYGFKAHLDFSGYTFKCGFHDLLTSEIVLDQRKIRVCGSFPMLASRPQAIQLLHMAAKRNEKMNTVALGPEAAREAVLNDPGSAIRNWANYVAFIERKPDPLQFDGPAPPYDPHRPPPYDLHDPPPYDG